MKHHAQHETAQGQTRGEAVDSKRHVAGVRPCQPGLVERRCLSRDLGARVADAHDQRVARRQLRGVAVLQRVELNDLWRQLCGERRNARALILRHGDDDVLCVKPLVAREDEESAVPRARHSIDAHARSNRQRERPRVGFEIVGHIVFRGERERRRRKRQAVEAGVTRRREETKRIPPVAPYVADARAIVEEDEIDAVLLQVVTDRKTCLPAADDDRIHVCVSLDARHVPPPSTSKVGRMRGAAHRLKDPSGVRRAVWVFLCMYVASAFRRTSG